jgi:SWI/SNF related-matrix-associated actin-dependent regulator of chromatin subfamily C
MSSESLKQVGPKKKPGIKKGVPGKAAGGENASLSIERDPSKGMNPKAILTGLYGSRGERIRHTVHDGALQMPREALDLIEQATGDTGVSGLAEYELPGLDAVIRPMIDPGLETITVTELCIEKVAVQQPPPQPQGPDAMQVEPTQPTVVHVVRTRAENRTITRTAKGSDITERIRGGGDDDNNDNSSEAPRELKPSANAPAVPVVMAPAEVQAIAPPTPVPAPPVSAEVPVSTPAPSEAATPTPVAASASSSQGPPPASALALQPAPVPASLPAPAPANQANVVQQATTIGASVAPASAPPQTIPATVVSAIPSAPQPTAPSSGASAVQQPAATPTTVTSTSAPEPAVKKEVPEQESLKARPVPQWEQHKPGPNDETVTPVDQLTPKPAWYSKDKVADIERKLLPEWFDSSAPHRKPACYIEAREKMIQMSEQLANRNLTNSLIRRSIVGDAGSLHRLRSFLVNWGLINEDGINDSAPTPAVLREETSGIKRFNDQLRDDLLEAVVQQSKRQKVEMSDADEFSFVPINWEGVAAHVGHGASSVECEREFLSMPIKEDNAAERAITPDVSSQAAAASGKAALSIEESGQSLEKLRQKIFQELVDESHPEVISKVTEAAIAATDGQLQKAQKAAMVGLVASRALEHARSQEDAVSSALSELVNQRMQKLENRMALMDDIEGMLEAERVTLELERRDLYTARCRHWFGGA